MHGRSPTTTEPDLAFTTVGNFRDVGGHATVDGRRVRTGVLYRSTELSRLAGEDVARFERLGIRRVYDLRTEGERGELRDALPPGIDHIVVDVLAGASGAGPSELVRALGDPRRAEAVLGAGRADRYFEEKYRELVALPAARAGFGMLFRDLADVRHHPALIHCMTGKDRTGWAAAALLMLVGVPWATVLDDYLRSNELLGPSLERGIEESRARGVDPALLRPLMEAREVYLRAAVDEAERRFGTIEAYFAVGLGLDDRERQRLREAFLEG